MKKMIQFIQKNFLSLLSCMALFVGTMAASSTTFLYTQQVKCPKELLK